MKQLYETLIIYKPEDYEEPQNFIKRMFIARTHLIETTDLGEKHLAIPITVASSTVTKYDKGHYFSYIWEGSPAEKEQMETFIKKLGTSTLKHVTVRTYLDTEDEVASSTKSEQPQKPDAYDVLFGQAKY